jgi:hypothetical protein
MKKFFALILIFSLQLSCDKIRHEAVYALEVHNDLNEVLGKKYFIHCLGDALDTIQSQFGKGNLDSVQFAQKIDSLLHLRTVVKPKCEITLKQNLAVNLDNLIKKEWLLKDPWYR